jgi:hypothetical protein
MLWLKKHALQGVLGLWLIPVSCLFLQVISRIAKRSLVSFCLTFSLFPPCFRYGYSPWVACPGRERLGCSSFGDNFTTGGSGNPFRRGNNRRRYELPG